tara:strand:+ start:8523 stop:9074 length:552 start_codon:yes stop_codon:yes gene_type:complete
MDDRLQIQIGAYQELKPLMKETDAIRFMIGEKMIENGEEPIKVMETVFGGSPVFGSTDEEKQQRTINTVVEIHKEKNPNFQGTNYERFVDFIKAQIGDDWNHPAHTGAASQTIMTKSDENNRIEIFLPHSHSFKLGWAGHAEDLVFTSEDSKYNEIYKGLLKIKSKRIRHSSYNSYWDNNSYW